MKPISLSIVIPAFNEEARLPAHLVQILSYLKNQDFSYEIIVVDDGSVDSTANVVERLAKDNEHIKLIRLSRNRGKGFAVKTGMLHAAGTLRLFTDADGSTPITELELLKKAIDAGADVAIGSRAVHDDRCVIRARLHRKVMGTIFNWLVNAVAIRGIKDTQCGFKLFTAVSATDVFALQRINDFGFDVEVLFVSHKLGYKICEVPINWSDTEGSKVSLGIDSFRMLCDIFRVRCNGFLKCYDPKFADALVTPIMRPAVAPDQRTAGKRPNEN